MTRASSAITIFIKKGGPLSKRIRLEQDVVRSDGSACVMSAGTAERYDVNSAGELADLIADLKSCEAIGLGALRGDLPNHVKIATKDALDAMNGEVRPDIIARTGANILFVPGRQAWALLDFETKGMSRAIQTRLDSEGGFWRALCSVVPALAETERVTRASTSAGLYSVGEDGSRIDYAESGGVHVYLHVENGADIVRFLQALHDRCWLAGFGWCVVSSGAQVLDRSIIDRTVGMPERLVFEGPPILEPPLKQDAKKRKPIATAGKVLDTFEACPPLTVAEKAMLAEMKAKAKAGLSGEVAKVREGRAVDLAKRAGISEEEARRVNANQCEGMLLPGVELPFDDPSLVGTTVADVLADPERYEGETLADPLEGVDYGRGKAKIMRRTDGSVWIHSFAHGRTIYNLKYDAAAVRAAIEAAPKEDAFKIFLSLCRHAALDGVESDQLRTLVAKRAAVGMSVVKNAIREDRTKSKAAATRAAKESALASRTDPRPRIERPRTDLPWGEVSSIIDDVLMKGKRLK